MARYSDKPVRRSQLISPFGVGAMIDFPKDVALMVAGLDAWPEARTGSNKEMFYEERLQTRLGVNHFRIPPDYESTGYKIPTVRFPRWHYCPVCKMMEKVALFRGGRVLLCRRCKQEKNRTIRLIPVRFVVVCSQGHIDDFPFDEWAHRITAKTPDDTHILRYTAGKSSTLGGIRISCSCGASFNMQDAFDNSVFIRMGIKCKGYRPWLGQVDEDYGCEKTVQTSQRGASNIYFPVVYSSIYLPLWAEKTDTSIVNLLDNPEIWSLLTCELEDGMIPKDKCELLAASRNIDADKLHYAALRKYEGKNDHQDIHEESFRYAEYEAFLNERGYFNTDLYAKKQNIDDYEKWFKDFFKNIVLIEKLRETRALSGFTRLIPPGERDDSGDAERTQDIKISKKIRWLPAVVVRGEGIFLEFRTEPLSKWIKNTGVEQRVQNLILNFNKSRVDRGISTVEHGVKFFFLHTFAHMLIKQLCFDCGYGSAALRERIYCNYQSSENKMHGILIYTAAGDSEGTMGGLVKQGEAKRLEKIIQRALQDAMWCSADPICIESPGQGTDNSNLAACHNCCLLPETSCEQGNRFLDRALLVGLPEDRKQGFFYPKIKL